MYQRRLCELTVELFFFFYYDDSFVVCQPVSRNNIIFSCILGNLTQPIIYRQQQSVQTRSCYAFLLEYVIMGHCPLPIPSIAKQIEHWLLVRLSAERTPSVYYMLHIVSLHAPNTYFMSHDIGKKITEKRLFS